MIEIMVDGRSLSKAGAAFSVMLRYGTHCWKRSIKLGKVTSNFAEMKAFEYAFKSINPSFLNEELSFTTSGRYALLMLELEDGKWSKSPKVNIELVSDVRLFFEKFAKVSVRHNSSLSGAEEKNFADLRAATEDAVLRGKEIFERI